MEEQFETGKKIIEKMVLKNSATYGLKIENMQWGPAKKDSKKNFGNACALVYFIENKRFSEIFAEEDIEDLAGDQDARKEMATRIEKIVKDKI